MSSPTRTKGPLCLTLCASAIALAPTVQGSVINFGVDWENYSQNVSGTDTSFTISDVDGSGLDLVVSLSGPGSTAFLSTTNLPVNLGDNPLNWTMNFASNLDWATISFEFFKSGTMEEAFVSGLAFDIYDIDRQVDGAPFSYIEKISGISGFNSAGAVFPESLVGTSNHSFTGSGFGTAVEGIAKNGNDDPNGTLAVGFGAEEISKFMFSVSNDPAFTISNPGLSRLAIGDIEGISYDPTSLGNIPEPGHYAAMMAALLAGMSIYFRKRRA